MYKRLKSISNRTTNISKLGVARDDIKQRLMSSIKAKMIVEKHYQDNVV